MIHINHAMKLVEHVQEEVHLQVIIVTLVLKTMMEHSDIISFLIDQVNVLEKMKNVLIAI